MLADLVASRATLGVNRRCDVHKVASFRCAIARAWRQIVD